MSDLQALGAIRLSKDSDASTSPERQQARIDWWAKGHGAQVVHTTKDLGVSGAVSPFERDELGEWLSDKPPRPWNVLVAWKLDRISRSAEDTLKLLNWCTKHGKRIVCVDDGIDTDTEMGKVWIQLAAIFAQVERTSIRERTLGSREKLRQDGRWAGGVPVYGLKAVPSSDGKGQRIAHDPNAYDNLRWIVERVNAGDSLNSVANRLNRDGVLTPQDLRRQQSSKPAKAKPAKWYTSTLNSILTSPTLLGHMSHKGKTVHGADGKPVKAGDAAVSLAEWKQLQARLVEGITPRERTEKTSLLLGIAFCSTCGHKLYRQSALKRGEQYSYYRCGSRGNGTGTDCGASSIRSGVLDEAVSAQLLKEIGEVEVTRKVLIPGEDHTRELEENRQAFKELTEMAGHARSETARQLYRSQMAALDERIADLEKKPHREDEWREEGTGVTYGKRWEGATLEERRALLIDSGITVKAGNKPFWCHVYIPHDILEQQFPGYEYQEPEPFDFSQYGAYGKGYTDPSK